MSVVFQVRDIRGSENWYASNLGIVAAEGSTPSRVNLDVQGTPIVLEPAHTDLSQFSSLCGGVEVEIEADDIDKFYGKVTASSAVIVQVLTKRMTDGKRSFTFADLNGYRLRVVAAK